MPLQREANWRIIPCLGQESLFLSIGTRNNSGDESNAPLEESARLPSHTYFGFTGDNWHRIVRGFWDEEAKKITFVTRNPRLLIYTGYLHSTNNEISGFCEDFSHGPERVVFGWRASTADLSVESRRAEERPLSNGDWTIVANGFNGRLSLSLSGANVSGSVFDHPIRGLWDDVSQKIAFVRQPNGASLSSQQFYTGYYFPSLYYDFLAGSFEAFSGTGGTAERVTYAWYALIGRRRG